jgi:hypothetical protein
MNVKLSRRIRYSEGKFETLARCIGLIGGGIRGNQGMQEGMIIDDHARANLHR